VSTREMSAYGIRGFEFGSGWWEGAGVSWSFCRASQLLCTMAQERPIKTAQEIT
jgi:hypothetical protein